MAFLHGPVTSLQFGIYILFPVGIMYYFGTNLDNRFSVPEFWPKPGQTHQIPFEKEDITSELERLKRRRLTLREERLERASGTEHRVRDESS